MSRLSHSCPSSVTSTSSSKATLRSLRRHHALLDGQRHTGFEGHQVVAFVVHVHADEVADAVVVVFVVTAGIAQYLHGLVVQLPPGRAGPNHADHGFLHVQGNLEKLPLAPRQAAVDGRRSLYIGGVMVDCRSRVGPHQVARLEDFAAGPGYELDPALGNRLAVVGCPHPRTAHRCRESQGRPPVAVNEVDDLHNLLFRHPRARGAEPVPEARAEAPLRQVATPRNWLRGRLSNNPCFRPMEIRLVCRTPVPYTRSRSRNEGTVPHYSEPKKYYKNRGFENFFPGERVAQDAGNSSSTPFRSTPMPGTLPPRPRLQAGDTSGDRTAPPRRGACRWKSGRRDSAA